MKYSSVALALALLSAKASPASAEPCTLNASKIKIQSTTGEPLSMREVRVFSGSTNVAIGKTATQSSNLNDSSGASKAVDGSWRTKATTDTSGCANWWQVDLGETTSINKVLIVNPDKSCDLSQATISLLDGDGEYVATKVVGNTCNKGWVVRKFEVTCPTASPTTSPSASPVTASPSASPVTASPSASPVTASPSASPVTASPSASPVTASPSASPVTASPTNNPTDNPTNAPTKSPTLAPISAVGNWEYYGNGYCADSNNQNYDALWYMDTSGGFLTDDQCKASCLVTDALLGASSYNVPGVNEYYCECYYENGHLPVDNIPAGFSRATGWVGTGPVAGLNPNILNRVGLSCYAYKSEFKHIKNSQNNGMCIGLQDGSTVANTAVWMYPCDPADLTTQKWHIDPTSGRIRPQGNKDVCMQANGYDAAATIETCSDNDNQRFTLNPEGRIQPNQGTGSSIGVQGGCGSITSVRVELQPVFADNGGCESQQKWIYV